LFIAKIFGFVMFAVGIELCWKFFATKYISMLQIFRPANVTFIICGLYLPRCCNFFTCKVCIMFLPTCCNVSKNYWLLWFCCHCV